MRPLQRTLPWRPADRVGLALLALAAALLAAGPMPLGLALVAAPIGIWLAAQRCDETVERASRQRELDRGLVVRVGGLRHPGGLPARAGFGHQAFTSRVDVCVAGQLDVHLGIRVAAESPSPGNEREHYDEARYSKEDLRGDAGKPMEHDRRYR